MGTEPEVKVLLRPRQMELNTEDKGRTVRDCLVEVVGAVRNRTRVKHRKASEPRVSPRPGAKPKICRSVASSGDGFVRSSVFLTRGELPASNPTGLVGPKNERTRV